MKPSMYLVASSLPGSLFMMPKPSGEWLAEDMKHYRAMGVDTIVSLLEPDEVIELSLQQESDISALNQIEFFHLAVRDRGLPCLASFEDLVRKVVKKLQDGRTVAVHCRAGIGRSGIVVCGALLNFGHTVPAAIELTSAARGVPVPDTNEQREFIEQFGLGVIDQD